MLHRGVGGLTKTLSFWVLTFQALQYKELLDDMLFAEKIGLESAWLADPAGAEDVSILEAGTALAARAAGTQRIRLGTLVPNVAMRNAMVLARQALTVDHVSN